MTGSTTSAATYSVASKASVNSPPRKTLCGSVGSGMSSSSLGWSPCCRVSELSVMQWDVPEDRRAEQSDNLTGDLACQLLAHRPGKVSISPASHREGAWTSDHLLGIGGQQVR